MSITFTTQLHLKKLWKVLKMKKFVAFLEKYVQPIAVKVSGNKFMLALRDGFAYTIPFTLIGSAFLLIACFPVPAVAEAIAASGWADRLFLVSGITFDMMAIIGVLGIAYHLAKSNDDDGIVVSILALLVFFLLQATSVTTESGEVVSGVIPKIYLGAKGMFTGIIVGLLVPTLYNAITKRKLTIKMPEQVPPAVAGSFSAIIPAGFVILVFWIFQICFVEISDFATVSELIYSVLQQPLQAISNTFIGIALIALTMQFFWFFGIHGTSVVMGVIQPILLTNSQENAALYAAGELSLENGANLVTANLFDQFIGLGGSGATLGIVIVMTLPFFFRSRRNRQIAKLAVGPGLCGINEPVLFGIPVILNPMLIVPFMVVPLVTSFITLGAIQLGIMPPFNGLVIPWTIPPIISGFLICGVMGSVIQVICLVASTLIWYPFMKAVDNKYYKEETETGEL